MGRPSDYTPEIASEICSRIAEGRSLLSISHDDDMPAKGTIFRWLFNNKEFQDKYTYAREAQADILAEQILDISDDSVNDYSKDGEGNEIVNHENIQRARLRVDARKWLAGKLRPKKYGDSTTIKGDKDNPLTITALSSRLDSAIERVVDHKEVQDIDYTEVLPVTDKS